jgi:DNA repair protein RecO (recombination protein O)
MSEERTVGVVVRIRLLTESSLIVQWITADAGRIATVARGARRPKSPYRGKVDLFHEAEFTFRRSRRSELHNLGEVGLRNTHPRLRTDWRRMNQVAYAAALIERATETDTPLPEIWELFRGFLAHVDSAPPTRATVLAFELKLLEELGLFPDLDRPSLSAEARALAERLWQSDWSACADEDSHEAAINAVTQFLHGFLIHQFDRLPRGRSEALARAERPPVRGAQSSTTPPDSTLSSLE